jgi:hypothetical protein
MFQIVGVLRLERRPPCPKAGNCIFLVFINNHYLCVQITISSILDDRRATVNGYPVKIRVTYKRLRKYYTTGKTLSIENWNKLLETKSKTLISIRSDIQNTFERIKVTVMEWEWGNGFSYDALNLRLGKANAGTINMAFQAKIEELMKFIKMHIIDQSVLPVNM